MEHRCRRRNHLVDLLHGALTSSLRSGGLFLVLLLSGLGILINVQTERDKLVNALRETGRFLNGETRDKQRGLEEKLSDRLHGAVVLTISLNLLLELLDDGRLGRDFEGLLGRHV